MLPKGGCARKDLENLHAPLPRGAPLGLRVAARLFSGGVVDGNGGGLNRGFCKMEKGYKMDTKGYNNGYNKGTKRVQKTYKFMFAKPPI